MTAGRTTTYRLVKRTMDVAVASGVLLVLSPVVALVALAVRYDVGSPVLFRQLRPGLGGEPFELVKFRTMRAPGALGGLSDGERMTRLGGILRRTSLDELPTLWNVLRGDMSLVGPRPLLMSYLERYTPEQRRRHEVRPGVTGLAQVRGRNALTWDQKFAADIEYVQNAGLRTDLRILLATVGRVATAHGISAPGEATTTEFTGSSAAVGDAGGAGRPAHEGVR